MEKDKEPIASPIISTVLPAPERLEVYDLAERMGVSLSHVSRALMRLGLERISKGKLTEKMLLELVILGK